MIHSNTEISQPEASDPFAGLSQVPPAAGPLATVMVAATVAPGQLDASPDIPPVPWEVEPAQMPPVQPAIRLLPGWTPLPISPPPPPDDDEMDKLLAEDSPLPAIKFSPEEEERNRVNEERYFQMLEDEQRALTSVEGQEERRKVFRGVNRYPAEATPATSILGDGWLRKGDLGTFIAPAGAGKSVAAIQAAMAWGIGLPYLGITPPRPLNILLFSGEDDGETIAECREGLLDNSEAVTRKKLTADDLQPLDQRLRISFKRTCVGEDFIWEMNELLKLEPADLVIINPLLAYLGGDVVATASEWLRVNLVPSFACQGCAGLVVHHTVKLPKGGWDGIDDTYSAIGGAELANIPRSILTLHPTDAEGLHVVTVSKRKTTGWKDSSGRDTNRYFVKRTDNPRRPAWLPVSSEDAARLIEGAAAKTGGRGRSN
jgi:hypothetical protein